MKVQDERENKSLTNTGLSSRKTSARSSFRAEVAVGTATIHSIRSNMQTKVSLKSGFTLVEIMIVVAIIGLLAAIAIPNLVTARKKAQRQACISSLKAIEGAKANWALDYKKGDNDVPSDGDLFGPEKYIDPKPTCPVNGTYNIGTVREKPTCSVEGHTL